MCNRTSATGHPRDAISLLSSSSSHTHADESDFIPRVDRTGRAQRVLRASGAARTPTSDGSGKSFPLGLADAVGPNTRQSFERLRTLFCYGLLCYDLFTIVDDLSLLLMEQALGERFVEYYKGRLPLVYKDGSSDELNVNGFQQVRDALNRGGSHCRGWMLEVSPGTTMYFRASLEQLLSWARIVGLLRGQKSRVMEHLLVKMRHRVAHSHSYHLSMPGLTGLGDLGAFINQLWGTPTPGSRLYDGPVDRIPIAVGWMGNELTWFAAAQLQPHSDIRNFTFVVIQACDRDDGLYWGIRNFNAQVEATSFPTELLWGPGPWSDAATWLDNQRLEPDYVEYVDRPFMVRVHDGLVDMPRRPGVAAGMGEDSTSKWHLVKADYPADAFVHARNVASSEGGTPCAPLGECSVCAATTLASGSLGAVLAEAHRLGIDTTPVIPADVRIPTLW